MIGLFGITNGQDYFRKPEQLISETRNVGDKIGVYSLSYETEGGILQKEIGSRKYAGTPDETQLIQGSVQYNAPDGTPISLSWTADEFGSQVSGSHLPTPPPVYFIIYIYSFSSLNFNFFINRYHVKYNGHWNGSKNNHQLKNQNMMNKEIQL